MAISLPSSFPSILRPPTLAVFILSLSIKPSQDVLMHQVGSLGENSKIPHLYFYTAIVCGTLGFLVTLLTLKD